MLNSIGLLACGALILLWAISFELNYRALKEREENERN